MLGCGADRIAPGVRRHECQSHVVFYVPDGSGVNIARVLRAKMDAPSQYVKESAGDGKQYVFPLLFFKRLSDVWDEEYRNAFDESGDAGYAQATADDRFIIPDGTHWSDVRRAARDVGRALRTACWTKSIKRSSHSLRLGVPCQYQEGHGQDSHRHRPLHDG